jgi:hypothetical protein
LNISRKIAQHVLQQVLNGVDDTRYER